MSFGQTFIGIVAATAIGGLVVVVIQREFMVDSADQQNSPAATGTSAALQNQMKALDDAQALAAKAANLQKQVDDARARAAEAEREAELAKQRAEQQRLQAEAAFQEQRRQTQAAADTAARQRAREAQAFRDANGGCDPGSHPQCLYMGTPGNMQSLGCPCVGD